MWSLVLITRINLNLRIKFQEKDKEKVLFFLSKATKGDEYVKSVVKDHVTTIGLLWTGNVNDRVCQLLDRRLDLYGLGKWISCCNTWVVVRKKYISS
jgi:hypothetical protein